ncbi:hypothetical protein DKZ29_05915 [Limosilactobacillus reuteri]|uniref:hypothetical protein n=1 Tax=Limosilactobacillus reuteri TaxID=1598 RepID=UPI000D6F95D4|nr:hypothetical protein [Limosilactobacillus reuteri]PWT58388.1 hypothetical protein DKZ29_05915 [Limosilactobacillus reuteri]
MDFEVRNIAYNFENGQTTSVQVVLYAEQVADGEYINSSIRVKQDDIPTGKSFFQVAPEEIVAIAKKKLAADTAFKAESTEPINQ